MKFMVIVLIIGYFIFIIGLYFVKDNDVSIFNYIMKLNIKDICSWI